MEKIVKHEYDIDATDLYLTILKIINEPKIKVTSKFNKTEYLKGIYGTLEFYCSSVGLIWKNQLKNKIPLIVPSTDNYYHTILSLTLCYIEEAKIKSLLDYQKVNFQGNFYTKKDDFISLVEFVCYKSVKNFCIVKLNERLSIIMDWVRERQKLNTDLKKINESADYKTTWDKTRNFKLKKEIEGKYHASKKPHNTIESVLGEMLKDLKGATPPFVSQETTLPQFKSIFIKEKILKPVHWVGKVGELHEFIDILHREKIQPVKKYIWKLTLNCFYGVNENGKPFTMTMLRDAHKPQPDLTRKEKLNSIVNLL